MSVKRWLGRNRGPVMPPRFEELAIFNAEVWRGIAHTPEKQARMRELQEDFNQWQREAHPDYRDEWRP